MRLKHVKGAEEFIAASPYTIEGEGTDGSLAGTWHARFGNANPIFVEIGCGKGQFLLALAEQNPQINYIGIEKYSSVLIRAVQKRASEPYRELSNIWFIRMDAEFIEEIFAPDEVSGIYLNFSDPWPKERHAKRRLTSHQFLARYEAFLKKDGEVVFKTDNASLYAFSLEEIEAAGWELLSSTDDLHADPVLCDGNVMTEYEEKFAGEGVPIHRYVARQKNE